MTWLKLPNVGDAVTVTIKTVGDIRDDTVGFSTTDGDILYLPKPVALARLRECGFAGENGVTVDYDRVSGAQLHFSKLAPEHGGTRPRWMIERPKAEVPNTHTNGAAPMDDATKTATDGRLAERDAKREAINTAYLDALDLSLEGQRKILKGKGIPKPTAESVQAGAATILIQWEHQRCL